MHLPAEEKRLVQIPPLEAVEALFYEHHPSDKIVVSVPNQT
jgi:alpha-D-ribose 1-methylphosphonate 5-phosphate C-P lyase